MAYLLRAGPHVLHLRTPDEARHWAFDPRGRLVSGHREDLHVQVGLDGTLLERRGERSFARPKRLSGARRDQLLDQVAEEAGRATTLLASGQTAVEEGDLETLAPWLEAAAGWDALAFARDREAFAEVYRPVRILPPDCYRALVVQLTEGCSYNRCSFCSLYRDVPFRAKSPDQLERHLEAIRGLLGPALALRTHVFLGDANACLIPQERLLRSLAIIKARVPETAERGFHTFLDVFTPPGKTTGELRELRAAGLRRVTVGLESGHAPLVSWLDKPGSPAEVGAAVARLRGAGIGVALVVLIGAGGHTYAEAHERETLAFLRALELGKADTVYLSPLRVSPGDPYSRRAAREGVVAFSEPELEAQAQRLRQGLQDQACKVALYDLERWIY